MATCNGCGQPANALTFPDQPTAGLCWDCISTPNMVAQPQRPPDVDPDEWHDYLAYRMAVLEDNELFFGPNENPYYIARVDAANAEMWERITAAIKHIALDGEFRHEMPAPWL